MDAHDPAILDDPSEDASNPDEHASTDDPTLTEYDETLADSFPSSDPPATP